MVRSEVVEQVRLGRASAAQAAAQAGVHRSTVHRWLDWDAQGHPLEGRSQRPLRSPKAVSGELAEAVLQAKRQHPVWGPGKLRAFLWPEGDAPLCARTVGRILFHNGLTQRRAPAHPVVGSFEASCPNELWQTDVKALGRYSGCPYRPLSVVDDRSRFCLGFVPIRFETADEVWMALWEIFGQYGLPERILSDNGPCFAGRGADGPGKLEARLWLLGIKTSHGRPFHPQTQGKVERFHRTVNLELGASLRQPDANSARELYEAFRTGYNQIRPHAALGQIPPARIYTASPRKRPDRLPEPWTQAGVLRKVSFGGLLSYKGREYSVSKGLIGHAVEIRELDEGIAFYFAGVRFKTVAY